MPLIVKDFSWHQTPTAISLAVPIPGLDAKKVDILTSSKYFRIHCHPTLFEAFLYSELHDEKGSCIIDTEKGIVFLNFPKTNEEICWPSLEAQGLDRIQKKVLRDNAVESSHQKYQKKVQDNSSRRDEDRKMSVQEQMRIDQNVRVNVAVAKKEADRALANFRTWTEKNEMIAGETMSHVSVLDKDNRKRVDNVSNRPEGLEVFGRLTKKGVGPNRRQKFKECESLEELVARGPLPISTIFSSDEEGQENPCRITNTKKKIQGKIFSSKAASLKSDSSKSLISPEGCSKSCLGSQKILPPRDFLTPASVSSAHLEEVKVCSIKTKALF